MHVPETPVKGRARKEGKIEVEGHEGTHEFLTSSNEEGEANEGGIQDNLQDRLSPISAVSWVRESEVPQEERSQNRRGGEYAGKLTMNLGGSRHRDPPLASHGGHPY